MVGRFRVGRQGIPRPRGLVCKASGLLVGLWAPRQRGLVSRVPCAASLPVTLECPAPHPLPGPPGRGHFVWSGSTSCSSCGGRAGETQEGGHGRAGEIQEGGTGKQVKPRKGGAGGQVKPEIGAPEGR